MAARADFEIEGFFEIGGAAISQKYQRAPTGRILAKTTTPAG